jgi:hypothetical protein
MYKVPRGPRREMEEANVEIFEKNIDLSLNEAFLKSVEEIGQTHLATNEYNGFFNKKLLQFQEWLRTKTIRKGNDESRQTLFQL